MPTKRTISFKPLQEGELRAHIAKGERLRGAIIVGRRDALGPYYVAYLSPTWRRGIHPLQLRHKKEAREFRDLVRLIEHIRNVYEYREPLTIYEAGCRQLLTFRGVLPEDQQPAAKAPGGENPLPLDGMDTAEE